MWPPGGTPTTLSVTGDPSPALELYLEYLRREDITPPPAEFANDLFGLISQDTALLRIPVMVYDHWSTKTWRPTIELRAPALLAEEPPVRTVVMPKGIVPTIEEVEYTCVIDLATVSADGTAVVFTPEVNAALDSAALARLPGAYLETEFVEQRRTIGLVSQRAIAVTQTVVEKATLIVASLAEINTADVAEVFDYPEPINACNVILNHMVELISNPGYVLRTPGYEPPSVRQAPNITSVRRVIERFSPGD